jgi:hypothetical protein
MLEGHIGRPKVRPSRARSGALIHLLMTATRVREMLNDDAQS